MSPNNENDESGLLVVATVSGMLKAEILKSLLQDAGIPAILHYESAGVVFGITIDGSKLSQVRILVQAQYAEQARQLLEAPLAPGWEEEATSL